MRARFESHDAEVRKSRRRQPALSAGPEHDGRDHGGDFGTRGAGSRSRWCCRERQAPPPQRPPASPRSSRSGTGCPARPHCSSAPWPNCCSRSGCSSALLVKLRRGDVAITVPAPFMLPYAFAAAAKLKGARSVLIMHDLYPDVLIMAGLLKPDSLLAKAMRGLNALMFRALDAVVIIGRDTEKLLLRYRRNDKRQDPFHSELGDARARRSRGRLLIILIAVRFPPASSSGFQAISALPTIPSSCSRPRACCGTTRISTSCCRAGELASTS